MPGLRIRADGWTGARTLHKRYDGDATISTGEHLEGWRFDGDGIRYFHPGSATEKLVAKLERMRAVAVAEEAESGRCMHCGAPGRAGVTGGDGAPHA